MVNSVIEFAKKLYEKFHNFILYGLFGAIAAVIDYGVFFVLTYTKMLPVPEAASIAGNICGFVFTFFTNTLLNFKKKDAFLRRFLLYFLICACGWGISSWLIHILEGVINVYVLKIGVMVLVTLFQYFMNKYITYRK